MGSVEQTDERRVIRSLAYGTAAVALWVGLAIGPVPAVARADTTNSESTSSETTDNDGNDDDTVTTDEEPSPTVADEPEQEAEPEPEEAAEPEEAEVTEEPTPEPGPHDQPTTDDDAGDEQELGSNPVVPEEFSPEPVRESGAQPDVETAVVLEKSDQPVVETVDAPPDQARLTLTESAVGEVSAMSAFEVSTLVEPTTPTPPPPLSPLARALALPGQIVNSVLLLLDLTTSATNPELPFNIYAPINNLIFGLFREWERAVGLYQPPPVQPAVATMTYDGPTTRPTPTVAQFLNAASAGYVLGASAGDMVPFTVDGFQMSSTNVFSGMVGRAWVTPEGQIIIAYQGTTGGSNLLFNPLITISQVIADIQVAFTDTTPWAFYDALSFANQVRAEAAKQGYTDDDIFVTGHSLGGWEAQYVAQQAGLAGIGFEAPGMNTTVAGNGADSMFVNIAQYGSPVSFMATDLPGLQPFMPPYVPGGGSKPHYGPIVMIGDPQAATPLLNASQLWGDGLFGSAIFLVSYLGNFLQYHLPGVQAYHLDVTNDPGIVPWLGTSRGTVLEGYDELTIPQLLAAASDDGILILP